jgi:protein tyrosine phosphatase
MISEYEIIQTEEDCYRNISHIFGNIYFGGSDFQNQMIIFNKYNIKAVLSVGGAKLCDYIENYKIIDVGDFPEENIEKYFEECVNFINEHSARAGILIHCSAGVSRSPTIAAAYIINKYPHIPLETIICFLRSTRCVIEPNAGFITQLNSYQNRLLKILSQNKEEKNMNL